MKICTRCGCEKPFSEFPRDRQKRDGLDYRCKACRRIQSSAYHAANREALVAAHKRRYSANRDERLARQAEYYQANRASVLEYQERYRQENRDKVAALNKRYRTDNPELVRKLSKRRRARQADAFVEDVDMEALISRYGGLCYLCEEPVEMNVGIYHPKAATLDHIIPIARGGEHSTANAGLACRDCNVKKGTKLPDEFRERRDSQLAG